MLEFVSGDIFESQADAFVCTVNTVGVMGKGIALEFKHRFPGLFQCYAEQCHYNNIKVGSVHVWPTGRLQPRFVINFPTKQHWRNPSRLEWIKWGLDDLAEKLLHHEISSVAVPALGCNLGGLMWTSVVPLFNIFETHPCKVSVFRPK